MLPVSVGARSAAYLAAGAMGILYKGFDPAIERTVAIKLRHLHQLMETMSAEVRARFRRNVRTGQRLSHLELVGMRQRILYEGLQFGRLLPSAGVVQVEPRKRR